MRKYYITAAVVVLILIGVFSVRLNENQISTTDILRNKTEQSVRQPKAPLLLNETELLNKKPKANTISSPKILQNQIKPEDLKQLSLSDLDDFNQTLKRCIDFHKNIPESSSFEEWSSNILDRSYMKFSFENFIKQCALYDWSELKELQKKAATMDELQDVNTVDEMMREISSTDEDKKPSDEELIAILQQACDILIYSMSPYASWEAGDVIAFLLVQDQRDPDSDLLIMQYLTEEVLALLKYNVGFRTDYYHWIISYSRYNFCMRKGSCSPVTDLPFEMYEIKHPESRHMDGLSLMQTYELAPAQYESLQKAWLFFNP